MSALPPALGPWAPALAFLPLDLALALGPWLPRLELVFGRSEHQSASRSGEPEGLAGLSRRGPPERLLVSEWLLALEEPLEFERRWAMQESLHLQLEHRRPAGERRSVLLLDSGPSQLGPPRLFQLAAWILAQTRALDEQAHLVVASLQNQSTTPLPELNQQSVLRWLEERSAFEPTAADWARWQAALALRAEDEVWLIGGPQVAGLGPSKVVRALVEEVLEPDQRALRAQISRPQRAPGTVVLALPEPQLATRLLRNPFEVPRAPPARRTGGLGADSQLHLAPSGRALYLRQRATVDRYLLDPGTTQAPPRSFSLRDQALVAIGERQRQVTLLTSDGERLSLLSYGRRGRFHTVHASDPLPDELGIWHPGADSAVSDLHGVGPLRYALDPGGSLLRLYFQPVLKVEVIARGVVAVVALGPALAFVTDDPRWATVPGEAALCGLGRDDVVRCLQTVAARQPLEAFVVNAHGQAVMAVRSGEHEWQIVQAQGRRDRVALDPTHQVIGLDPGRASLVRLNGARNGWRLSHLGAPASHPLAGVASAIVVRGSTIAYRLEGGGLRALRLPSGQEIFRLDPETSE